MTENKVLLINEVAERLRVSHSSINRWLGQSRKGIGTFPIPISTRGGKLRWLASDIDRWLESQSIATSPIPTTAKQRRRNEKAHAARQEQTDRALARYRTKGEDV